MLAYDYPLMSMFLSFLYFFLFFIWIWIAITVVIDIFRSRDLGGVAKALWVVFVIFLPYLGVFVYLIARGGKMHERQLSDAKASQDAFAAYVQQTAGAGSSVPDQLHKLADLRDRGVITPEEFDTQKAKLLG